MELPVYVNTLSLESIISIDQLLYLLAAMRKGINAPLLKFSTDTFIKSSAPTGHALLLIFIC